MKPEQFLGKVAIITGAANGIGLATVEKFASKGADIVAVDLQAASLRNAVTIGEEMGRRVIAVEADVSVVKAWQKIVERALEAYDRIDILINSAGISGPIGRFAEVTPETFDKVMAVNVRGIFLGIQAVIPTMKALSAGHIVNISSISGERGSARVAAYTASKHAVNGLTKSAALDLIEYGIHVNAVSPSPIDTAMMKQVEEAVMERLDLDSKQAHEMMSRGMPMGRYGKPEEVAEAIAFLCSDAASLMNGAIMSVDGGSSAR